MTGYDDPHYFSRSTGSFAADRLERQDDKKALNLVKQCLEISDIVFDICLFHC
jgi:hypothetical protein